MGLGYRGLSRETRGWLCCGLVSDVAAPQSSVWMLLHGGLLVQVKDWNWMRGAEEANV